MNKEKILDFVRFGGHVFPNQIILDALSHEVYSLRTYSYGCKDLEQLCKEKFASYISIQYGAEVEQENVFFTSGTKQALGYAILALTKIRDNILIPTPAYSAYQEISLFFNRNIVTYDLLKKDIVPEIIQKIQTLKPVIIILNFPHNPTGRILTQDEYLKILDITQKYNTIIIHDIVFCDYIYKNAFKSIFSFTYNKKNVLEYYSFSKSHHLSGVRLGGIYGDAELIKCLKEHRDVLDYPVSTFAQYGALLSMDHQIAHKFSIERSLAKKKIDLISEVFNFLNIEYIIPEGGVCLFAEAPVWSKDKTKFHDEMLEKLNIKIFPGFRYGKSYENYFRITVMPPFEDVQDFVNRLYVYGKNQM